MGDGGIDGATDGPLDEDGGPSDGATGDDAPGPSDAGRDAPPSGAALSCATWKLATPLVLEDDSASASGFFGGQLSIAEVGSNQLRVVSQPGTGPAFRVFTVDKGTSSVATQDGPVITAGTYQKAERFAIASSTGTEVLVQAEARDGSDDLSLSAWLIPDTLPTTSPLPSPIQVSPGGSGIAAMPFDASTIFAAVTYLESSGIQSFYGLGVARATSSAGAASLANVSLSPNVQDFGDPQIAHAGGMVYIFASNGPSITGESIWAVPDTATIASPPTPSTFDQGVTSRMLDIAAAANGTDTNFAYYTTALDGSSSVIRVGSMAASAIPTATASALATARTYTGRPFETALPTARWAGDDLTLVGPAATTADGGGGGLNVLWVTAQGVVQAEQVGAQVVLPGNANVQAAAAVVGASGAASSRLDVVWVEQRGAGEVLLYNELDCQ